MEEQGIEFAEKYVKLTEAFIKEKVS